MKILSINDLNSLRKRAQQLLALREESSDQSSEQCCGLATGAEHLQVLCCGGTGCKASNSHKIVDNLKAAIEENGITDKVDVITTGCFGFCEKGPIVKIMPDNTFYTQVKPEDAAEIVKEHIIGGRRVERLLYVDPKTNKTVSDSKHMDFYRKQMRIALRNCGLIDPENIEEYIARDGYQGIANALLNQTPEEVIEIIKASGLRGRGGAGFPTGMKWGFARGYDADEKYVVCNADEGDPGAFVCGEETALIHSMEGKRGEPTLKPPFPAEAGYNMKPTNVNNVETLANVPIILTKGADWFASIGTEKSKGTKVFALAGKINNVGLIEVPMGTTLREIIYDIGGGVKNGKEFKAVQTGGPSGGCLTQKHLDTPIDYEHLAASGSMMGSGGMIVMDEDDCMVSVAKFYLEFTCDESCGKCTPCRIGNKRMLEILTRITEGKGTMEDLDRLKELGEIIKDTALCGLGQTSPNPVLSTINNFWDEYVEHVKQHTCRAKQFKALVTYSIEASKCKGCGACARKCPANAIMGDIRKPHIINPFECIRCGMCKSNCRFDAISVY